MPKRHYSDFARDDALVSLITDVGEELRLALNITEQAATELAKTVVTGLQKKLGAGDIYLPAIDKAERNAQVLREFNGQNHKAVCEKNQISLKTLYNILNSRPRAPKSQRGGFFVVKGMRK